MAAQERDFGTPGRDELQLGAVGRLLRETRESYRQDLATVSQQLRIRSVYLKAIEDGRYQDLPGSTYAVGFVRTYAEYLGLDPQEIVRRFRDEDAEVNRRTRLVFPVPTVEARVPSGALVLVALLVAVLAYGGWYWLSDRNRDLVDLVPAVPETLRDLVEPGAETADGTTTGDATSAVTVAAADAASMTPGEDTETDAAAPAADAGTTEIATAMPTVEIGAGGSADASSPMTDESAGGVDDSTAAADDAGAPGASSEATELALATGSEELAAATADAADAAATEEVAAGTQEEAAAAASEAGTTLPVEDGASELADETAGADLGADAAATASDAAAAETEIADSGIQTPAATPTVTEEVVRTPAAQQVAAIPEAPRAPDTVTDSQTHGVAFGGSRVVIVARMESFLRVRDASGAEIWSRLLRSGDRYLVPEREGLTLSVGNAGGIDIFVDGAKAPSVGAIGVGVTGIALDPDRLKAGTAVP